MNTSSHWSQVVGRLKVGKEALECEVKRLTKALEGKKKGVEPREGVGKPSCWDQEVGDAIDLLRRAVGEGEGWDRTTFCLLILAV